MRIIAKNGKRAILRNRRCIEMKMWFDEPVKKKGYMNTKEFAQLVGISVKTLRKWRNQGKIIPIAETECGYPYYTKEQLSEALKIKEAGRNYNKSEGFNVTQFSKIIGVHPRTIYNWEKSGKLLPDNRDGNVICYNKEQIPIALELKAKSKYYRSKLKDNNVGTLE